VGGGATHGNGDGGKQPAGGRRGLSLSTQTGKVALLDAAIAVAIAHELDPAAAGDSDRLVELIEGLIIALGCHYSAAADVMRFLQMAHGRLLGALGKMWKAGSSASHSALYTASGTSGNGRVSTAAGGDVLASHKPAVLGVGQQTVNTQQHHHQLPFQEVQFQGSAAAGAAAATSRQHEQQLQQLDLQEGSTGVPRASTDSSQNISGVAINCVNAGAADQLLDKGVLLSGVACDRAVAQLLYLMYGVDLRWRRASYYSSKDGKWVLGEASWVQRHGVEGEEESDEDEEEVSFNLSPRVIDLQVGDQQPLLLQLWQYLIDFMPHRRSLLYLLELHLQQQDAVQQKQLQQEQQQQDRQQQGVNCGDNSGAAGPGGVGDDNKLQDKTLALIEGEYWKTCSSLLSVLVEVLPPPPAEVVQRGVQQIVTFLDDAAVIDDAALAMGSEEVMHQLDRWVQGMVWF
jgi:hypothetical protein